jgi:hypothetical protein
MLRVEAYPVLDGVMVRFIGTDHSGIPKPDGENTAAVTRTVAQGTIEAIGLNEALRDCFVDVAQEYPGLLGYAVR